MKQRDLVKKLVQLGYTFHHHGQEHDIYRKPNSPDAQVPRHREVNENTARRILKEVGFK